MLRKVPAPDLGENFTAIYCDACLGEVYLTWNAGEASIATAYQDEEIPEYTCHCVRG